jgi:hypothetical protein
MHGHPASEDAVILGDEHLAKGQRMDEQGLCEHGQNLFKLCRMRVRHLLEEEVLLGVEVVDARLEPVQRKGQGVRVHDALHVAEVGDRSHGRSPGKGLEDR